MTTVRPLRVLIVTTGFPSGPDDYRGIFVYRTLRYQLQQTENEYLVLTPESSEARDLDFPPGCGSRLKIDRFAYLRPKSWQTLTKGSIVSGMRGGKLGKLLQVPFLLFGFLKNVFRLSRKFDVIHCQWSASALFPVMLKFWHKIPVVVTVQGSDLALMDRGIGRWMNNLVFRGVDGVIVMTQTQRELLNGRAKRDWMIPNGVDTGVFFPLEKTEARELKESLGLDSGRVTLLFVGMLIWVKGLDLLIDAMEELAKSGQDNFQLVLVGDGELRQELEERVLRYGLEERVVFAGKVDPSQIPRWTRCADIAVSSSHSEGLATTLCEAAACALPIVATLAGDTDRIVDDGKTGYILRQRDAGRFAKCCGELIADESKRYEMGRESLALLRERRITSEACAEGYERVYREVCGKA